MQKIDKHYVSDIDKFLSDFDDKHPKSQSQLKEIEKHRRIAEMRDHENASTLKGNLLDEIEK